MPEVGPSSLRLLLDDLEPATADTDGVTTSTHTIDCVETVEIPPTWIDEPTA